MSVPSIFLQHTIKEIIKKFGLDAHKSLGQNFIINPSLTRKIVSVVEDLGDKLVLEVGSVPGCLTMAILEQDIKKLFIVEKDNRFRALLNSIEDDSNNRVKVLFDDALDIDFSSLLEGSKLAEEKFIIISNLPYNISTPFLLKSCNNYQYISEMLLMFQKEVADRIVALPGNKNFGRLSVMTQSFFDVKKVLNVSNSAFIPEPKVQSAVVHFKVNKKIPTSISSDDLSKTTQLLFSKRRKKISTILSSYKGIEELGIDLNLRPDHLQLSDFFTISELVKS